MKVTLEAVNSANVKVNNSVDAEKVYKIAANLNLSGKVVNNVSDGVVKQDEVVKANFQQWNEQKLNIQFQTRDGMEMCTIINAINAFIADCEGAVTGGELNI